MSAHVTDALGETGSSSANLGVEGIGTCEGCPPEHSVPPSILFGGAGIVLLVGFACIGLLALILEAGALTRPKPPFPPP